MNYKGLLQEYCMKNGYDLPVYNSSRLKDDTWCSTSKAVEKEGYGSALTKKDAEQNAAKDILSSWIFCPKKRPLLPPIIHAFGSSMNSQIIFPRP